MRAWRQECILRNSKEVSVGAEGAGERVEGIEGRERGYGRITLVIL